MIEIKTETIIAAPVAQVWRVLTNTNEFHHWNQFMTSVEGELKAASKLRVTIVPPGKKATTFTPTIIKFDANNHELRWVGLLGFAWLFRGEHYFQLQTVDANKTRFIHGENFSGILAAPILGLIKKPTIAGFELMNRCLAQRVRETV